MAIERDIRELLHTHDLVIVPGFGGLLGHRRAARIDEAHRLIHPPSKDISFNRQLVRNDGLLSDHIASRRGLLHAQAVEVVDRAVARWKTDIERSGRAEISGIGTFFNDSAQNLQFEADRRTNHLKDAFGLKAVAAVPVEVATSRVIAAPTRVKEPVIRRLEPVLAGEENGSRRAPILWAAAITTGVLFAASAWLLSSDGLRDRVQLGSFDLFGPSEKAQYVPPASAVEEFDPVDDDSWAPPSGLSGVQAFPIAGARGPLVHVDLGAAPAQASITTPDPAIAATALVPDKTHVATHPVSARRYHVIGGCFSVKDNADRFLSDLRAQGFDAALLDQHHGLYRVAFGSYPDKSTAVEAMSALRKDQGVDLWLLVK